MKNDDKNPDASLRKGSPGSFSYLAVLFYPTDMSPVIVLYMLLRLFFILFFILSLFFYFQNLLGANRFRGGGGLPLLSGCAP